MSKRDPAILLQDMRDSMRKIERYIVGMNLGDFLGDEKTVDAVVRNIEIIGEASKQVPDDFKQQNAHIPWAQMAGMRNRIVHDYAGVDLELVWSVVTRSLPSLARQIEDLP